MIMVRPVYKATLVYLHFFTHQFHKFLSSDWLSRAGPPA
jgi:hypothetical protein